MDCAFAEARLSANASLNVYARIKQAKLQKDVMLDACDATHALCVCEKRSSQFDSVSLSRTGARGSVHTLLRKGLSEGGMGSSRLVAAASCRPPPLCRVATAGVCNGKRLWCYRSCFLFTLAAATPSLRQILWIFCYVLALSSPSSSLLIFPRDGQ
eukprot:6214690-Pleurochrysis_carterae.AAC.2